MIYHYIYCTTNLLNGKNYIGQRKQDSLKSDKYFGSGTYLRRAIKKYGVLNFEKYILEVCENTEQANFLEKLYIRFYRLGNKAEYNITDGGQGTIGYIFTDEVKRKIGEKSKGNKNMLGKHHSEETKKRIKETMKRIGSSEEFKNKLKERKPSFEGRYHTDEAKKKLVKKIKENQGIKETKTPLLESIGLLMA
jgi:group I intron endonuclease